MLSDNSVDAISERVIATFEGQQSSDNFALDLEAFTAATLVTKDFDIAGFARLMEGINMDFETLYVGYVGKNVLNFFRQDNGYKDGSYHKQWGGKEDNEHLVDIVAQLDTASPDFSDDLYRRMDVVYNELTG